jgi:hypothetical protein
MIGGEYRPSIGDSLRLLVGTDGELTVSPPRNCGALLGGKLSAGLPDEFGQAALNGLVRFEPQINRPGILTVGGAAYDEADSSEYAFEHSAALLKWVLLTMEPSDGLSVSGLTKLLEAWTSP